MTRSEPRNPFYLFLLVASLLFVVTALGYGIVPILEQNARAAGQAPPPSPFRDRLRSAGWKWLLYEVAIMGFFAFLSMGLDRLRTLEKQKAETPGQAVGPSAE
jgi:hypothetical protein